MSRYETYKPSGIDWIGDLPEHWNIIRVKGNCYVKGRIGWQELRAEEFLDEGIHCVTGTDFKNQFVNWDSCYRVSLERYLIDDNIQLKEGDVLITKDGTIGKTAIVKDLPEKATLNSGIFLVRPEKAKLENEYLYWILNSKVFEDYNDFTKTGATILHLYQNVFVEMHFPLPDNDEQLAIANYLDDKTQKIDRLITNKKAQAEKLKELRQIEINNAVTKGLIPNAEMKVSGIEWLGKIPKHWEVKKVKQLLKPEKNAIKTGPFGSDLKFEDLVEQGIKVYNQRSVLDNDWVSGEGYITEEKYKALETCTIFPGDIVITTRGTIGKASIFPDNAEIGILHPCLMRVQMNNNRILNDFLKIIINESGYFLEALKLASNATTIDVVYSDNLKEVKIALPPSSEQEEIIAFVVKRTTAIDQLIKNIEAQIEKLQELRKIKIYEAVTGKIKVNAYAETTA